MPAKTEKKQAAPPAAAAVDPGSPASAEAEGFPQLPPRLDRLGNRFQPGQSGNPGGRPKGAMGATRRLCSDLLGDNSEAIMATLVKKARQGHGVALKLCVERMVPVAAVSDRATQVEIPAVERAEDVAIAAAEVLRLAAAGSITLVEAAGFMRLFEAQRRIIETAELVMRIEALESTMKPILIRGPGGGPLGADPDLGARVRSLVEAAHAKVVV